MDQPQHGTSGPRSNRRRILQTIGGVGLLGVAGCSGGGGTPTPTEVPTQFEWRGSDHEVGDRPGGLWRPMANLTQWSIDEDDDGSYLSFKGKDGSRTSLRFRPVDKKVNVDIRATIKAVDPEAEFWVYARGNNEDTPGNLTVARANDRPREDAFELGYYLEGALTSMTDMPRKGSPEDLYHMRARMDDQTFQAKWWLGGESEPGEWSLEGQPKTVDPGYVGLGHWTGGPAQIYEYTVGVDGSDAPDLTVS